MHQAVKKFLTDLVARALGTSEADVVAAVVTIARPHVRAIAKPASPDQPVDFEVVQVVLGEVGAILAGEPTTITGPSAPYTAEELSAIAVHLAATVGRVVQSYFPNIETTQYNRIVGKVIEGLAAELEA
jgi:hypothetical protein